jgi:hypothetical protein
MIAINRETVRKILVEDLKKKKVCVLVSFLICYRRIKNINALHHLLNLLKWLMIDRSVLKRIVVGDECWCFMYNPETKRQSATWLSPKKPKAQKVRMQKSRVKTMLAAFFDARGIIHHEFVPEKQTK